MSAGGELAVRRLAYSDLPAVISIERRSFPTPWSLAMFVLELSKPSGICLAATAGEELLGYLVCSRYDQVWHLMNVAVAPERRRAGVATRLIAPAVRGGRRRAAVHARGAGLQPRGDRDVRGPRLPLRRRPSPLLPGQRRGRADHVAGLSHAGRLMRKLTCSSLSRPPATTPARRCSTGPRILANMISSQAEAHARFGGVVPEVASRHHLELAAPVVEAALAEAGATLDEVEAVAVTAGPGLIGALLVGVSTAKAIAAAAAPAADPGRPPAGPRRRQLPRARAARAALPLPGRQRRPHPAGRGAATTHGHEVLGQTLDDAAGEAFDKVARMLGLGYPGGPALERLAAEGDPEAFELPVAMSRDPGLDFSFSGLKTALVYLCRDLGARGRRGAPRRPRRRASRRPRSAS